MSANINKLQQLSKSINYIKTFARCFNISINTDFYYENLNQKEFNKKYYTEDISKFENILRHPYIVSKRIKMN
jgi:hypothetical protein